MGRLPFEQLDMLVIGEIGKNYSGAGIDPNVVGRLLIETQPEFESPQITRICASTCRRRATATAPASASPT